MKKKNKIAINKIFSHSIYVLYVAELEINCKKMLKLTESNGRGWWIK